MTPAPVTTDACQRHGVSGSCGTCLLRQALEMARRSGYLPQREQT